MKLEKLLIVRRQSSFDYAYKSGELNKLTPAECAALMHSHKTQYAALNALMRLLSERAISYAIADEEKPAEEATGFDLIIALGGDRTVLRAAARANKTPLLSINADSDRSRGGLCNYDYRDLEKILPALLKGNFKLERWTRLEAVLDSKLIGRALNEIYVGKARVYSGVARYMLCIDNFEEEQRSSGLIIAPGAGSTAWYHSAGGQPFGRTERCFGFVVSEPQQAETLEGKFYERGKLRIRSKMYDGVVALDGGTVVQSFKRGSVLEVSLSDKPLKVVIFD